MTDRNIGVMDPDEVKIMIAGIRIRGFPEDGTQFWASSRVNADDMTATEGTDGNVLLSRRRNDLVMGALTLSRTSSSLTRLHAFYKERRGQLNSRLIAFPFECVHLETNISTATALFKSGPPDAPSAGGIVNLTYELWLPNAIGELFTLSIEPQAA